MFDIKKRLLSNQLIWSVNSALKSRKLNKYYNGLRERYSKLDSSSFEALLQEAKQKYQIRFSPSDKVKILFVYDRKGWVQEHLELTFSQMGTFDVITYVDTPEAILSDRISNGKKLLESLAKKSDYDVIFIGGSRGNIAHEYLQEAMATYRIPVINFQFDDKQIFTRVVDDVEIGSLEAARGTLLTFTNAKYSVDWYLKEGCPAVYLPEGSTPEIYSPKWESEKDIDVGFFGANYGLRGHLISHLRRNGIEAQGFGPGWPSGYLTFEKQKELIQRSKIVISHEGIGYNYWPSHLKGKTFDFAMAGACLLTSFSSEIGDWFEINKEILCYYNFDDAVDVARYYLNHDQERTQIARAAYEKAISEHTWKKRFETIFKMIEN